MVRFDPDLLNQVLELIVMISPDSSMGNERDFHGHGAHNACD